MTRRHRWLLVAVLAAVLATGTAACAEDATGRVVEIIVPAGTGDRLRQGETVAVMPAELRFTVGDTLKIRNEDSHGQVVGPYWVDAGKTFTLTYGSPGRFEGACTLSAGQRYEIVVTR